MPACASGLTKVEITPSGAIRLDFWDYGNGGAPDSPETLAAITFSFLPVSC